MSLHSLFTRQQVTASRKMNNKMSKYDEAEVTVQVLGLCKHPNTQTRMLATLGGGLLGGFCKRRLLLDGTRQ